MSFFRPSYLIILSLCVFTAACSWSGGEEPQAAQPDRQVNALGGHIFEARDILPETEIPPVLCLDVTHLRADYLVRLQTELMVTALQCGVAQGNTELFTHYADFASQHQEELIAAQNHLGQMWQNVSSGSVGVAFDRYHTLLSNAESQRAQAMGGSYCAIRLQQFQTIRQWSDDHLQSYLDYSSQLALDDRPLCRTAQLNP